MRVDYLRPGLGECFYANGKIIRSGRKVTVVRMELHNNGCNCTFRENPP
ncbi:hotdog domain-containing protein [Desulfobacter hydrogenophilus]|nr:hypothetical protein [Desulfobacter hydrogenophilus]